ncbi:MAG TPA: hypothetical protein VIH93_14615 [Thermoanaerobaculia bacterium]|jgi:hypothetical protein
MIDRQRRLIALLVVVIALCAALSVGATSIQPQNQVGPGDGSSDGGCYCGTALCGCSSAPPGYSLTASCTCGSTCTRTCTYTSTHG